MVKKKDVFFVVSKSGKSKPTASFYDEKGRRIKIDNVNVSYKRADTGRFVTKNYTTIGREAKTGEFVPVKECVRRPRTTTIERIPKPGRGGSIIERIPKDSPIYFRNKKK